MDDPDASVQEAVCAACEVAAGRKPGPVKEAMAAARGTHRHPRFIDRVMVRRCRLIR
jgi:hypothetical protein